MPGQTKLYQRAGSPLIMGHSRYERSAWVEWFVACVLSILGLLVVHAVATLLDPTRPYLRSFSDLVDWLWAIAPAMLTAVAVSGAIVWYGHRSGWRRTWVVGAWVGAVAGLVVMLLEWWHVL